MTSAQEDERHQLPGEQEDEGVIGEDDQRHAGEEGGNERDHAGGLGFVASVADCVDAGAGASEADEHQKRGRQGIEPEIHPDPGQAQRQP